MIWAFAVFAVAILYLALRFRRFQSWVEPVLTIVVAIGLAVAVLIWFVEDRSPTATPATPETADTGIPADAVVLSDLEFSQGQTATSYRITGRIENRAAVPLQSFRLDVVLSDCTTECLEVGRDSAMIVQRVVPGDSADFTTFVIFSGLDLRPVAAPKWDWTIRDPRASSR